MAIPFVIGIDCSTTACKAIAWDPHGKALAEGRAAYPILSPQPDWSEQEAEQWWQAACSALKELSYQVDVSRAEGLCITAQRESFVLVDRQGQSLRNAILWLDERSREQVNELVKTFGSVHLHALTGKPPSMSLALPKLLWLKAHEPDALSQAAQILDTHAYLVYRLTGKFTTSLACADPLGLVDMRAQTWAADLIRELGLRGDQFPELVQPGTLIGTIDPSGSAESGLPTGLPIIAGAGDGQCAGLGANAIQSRRACLNLGTAVVSGALSAEYRVDPAFRTLFGPYEGCFYLETVIRGGVSTINWFIDRFANDLRRGSSALTPEEQLDLAAARVPAGCSGLILVPYWNSVLNPYWDPLASGMVIGWTSAHGREHFYRAILEGIAFEQRLASDGMMKALGRRFEEIVAVGGGSRSPLWRQIIANIVGLPVLRAETREATCLGAGILAAARVGWYPDVGSAADAMTEVADRLEPQPEVSAYYERLFQDVYLPLFPTLRRLVDRLTELSNS
jgi:sugar (pentulose or hexulose) kinase